jgi:hypothetical protein
MHPLTYCEDFDVRHESQPREVITAGILHIEQLVVRKNLKTGGGDVEHRDVAQESKQRVAFNDDSSVTECFGGFFEKSDCFDVGSLDVCAVSE